VKNPKQFIIINDYRWMTSLLKIKYWALFTIFRVLIQTLVVMVVLSDHFRRMRARKNSTVTQQSSHAPRSGLEVKNGRSDGKYGVPKGSDAGQFRRRLVRSCRWCPQEEFFFRLSCIDKKTKEGYDRGSEVGTVHSERDGKGQFLWGNWRNLVKEKVMRKMQGYLSKVKLQFS